jgi:general secretion pathway protein E/type IV pilus assembly protein PilB
VSARDDYLLDQLIDLGYVTHEQVAAVRPQAEEAGVGIVDFLIEQKIIRSIDVATAKAAHFGVEAVNLHELRLDDDVISSVPRHVAKRYRVIPVFRHGNSITIAMSDPSDLDTIDSLTHLLNAEITVSVATDDDIAAALKRYSRVMTT